MRPTSPADSEQRLEGGSSHPCLGACFNGNDTGGVWPQTTKVDARLTLQFTQGHTPGAAEDAGAGVKGCLSPRVDSGRHQQVLLLLPQLPQA